MQGTFTTLVVSQWGEQKRLPSIEPSARIGANAAWQKLAVLAHNISVSLQLRNGAQRKARSAKRTTAFFIQRIATLRFQWLNLAGRILRPQGKLTMRMADNDSVREHYEKRGIVERRIA